MSGVPEIHYARSGEVHVAYQTWGRGPALVGVPPFAQNIDACWSDPSEGFPRFLRRLGSFSTVTHFDKRGTGLSDRAISFAGVEERMDDIRAVMDAAQIERASITGVSEGGPMAILFAATYPDRVESLVLIETTARFVAVGGYESGPVPEVFDAFIDQLVLHWGTADSLGIPFWTPSMVGDEEYRQWMMTYERACASPGAVRDIGRFVREIDVRSVLPTVVVPTLVLHRTGDVIVPVDHGRYLATHIPGARLVELSGSDHMPWVGDADAMLDEIEEFLTGERSLHLNADRVLATVVFTDIVASTERAGELGDQRWRKLLDRHDAATRRELDRHGGRDIKSTGDGFLATFESPSRGVRAALAISEAAKTLGLEVRAGVHTGEVERRGGDVSGIGVHVGARISALAGASETLVSSTVRDLVLGSDFRFENRGRHALKGVEGDWPLFAVTR